VHEVSSGQIKYVNRHISRETDINFPERLTEHLGGLESATFHQALIPA